MLNQVNGSELNYGYNSNPSILPWDVSINLEQFFRLRTLNGDSKANSALPPLMQSNDTIAGIYNFHKDQDDYSIAIDHGTMQHIVVTTEAPTEIQFYHNECGRDGYSSFSSNGEPSNIQFDSSLSTHTFWCDTRYIADEIDFSLKHTGPGGSTAVIPATPNSYSVEVFTTPLNNTFESSNDSPARGLLQTISSQEIEGSFRHWSDQTDGYQIITAPGEDIIVNLSSNCATLMTSKLGYHESISSLTHPLCLTKKFCRTE